MKIVYLVIYLKKLILILGILAVMVMASGCISSSSSNKTYSSNGVSFTYPGDWSVQNNTQALNISNVIVWVGNEKSAFALANVTIPKNKTLANTTQWATGTKSNYKNSGYEFVSEKSRTVDGANGYELVFRKSGNYSSYTYFVKNGTPYLAAFNFIDSNMQTVNETVDMVLNSLKVP